jgi:hypothetical protein
VVAEWAADAERAASVPAAVHRAAGMAIGAGAAVVIADATGAADHGRHAAIARF